MQYPLSLTIATSDSGGNAGVQADLKTFTATGSFGSSVFVALTAQNPVKVSAIEALPVTFIREQFEQIFNYYEIDAMKAGMLLNREIIECVAACLGRLKKNPALVIDTVMVSSSGHRLLEENAIETLERELIPMAALITPNLDEAAILLKYEAETFDSIEDAAIELFELYKVPVLLKGGHFEGDIIRDILVMQGKRVVTFSSQRIHGVNTHGSGCTLSAAITSYLAQGMDLERAVALGREYLYTALLNPIRIHGEKFIHHGWPLNIPHSTPAATIDTFSDRE